MEEQHQRPVRKSNHGMRAEFFRGFDTAGHLTALPGGCASYVHQAIRASGHEPLLPSRQSTMVQIGDLGRQGHVSPPAAQDNVGGRTQKTKVGDVDDRPVPDLT